jgi:hypothetical protein
VCAARQIDFQLEQAVSDGNGIMETTSLRIREAQLAGIGREEITAGRST